MYLYILHINLFHLDINIVTYIDIVLFFQIKYSFLLQVCFGPPTNSTLYLHVKKMTIVCKTCVERIRVRLNLV